MILCKVIGTIVATQKNRNLKDKKLLTVQPIDLESKPIGRDLLAIDTVDVVWATRSWSSRKARQPPNSSRARRFLCTA